MEETIKDFIKKFIVFTLIWACIIFACTFDPSNFWGWFKVEICLVGATAFFWWIFDFKTHFADSEDEII